MDCENSGDMLVGSGSSCTSGRAAQKGGKNCNNGRQSLMMARNNNCGNTRCNQNGVVQPLLTGEWNNLTGGTNCANDDDSDIK